MYIFALVLLLAMGCAGQTGDSDVSDPFAGVVTDTAGLDFGYPLDGQIRVNHAQVKGTHNSYHVEPPDAVEFYQYTHAPLSEQANVQGVRQFELDVHYSDTVSFPVYHVIGFDDVSTCATFYDCLLELREWSDANLGHYPLIVMVEPKDELDPESITPHVVELDTEILRAWPRGRVITPDDVQGKFGSLREAVETAGWPTLGEARGRAIFVLLDSGEARDIYTDNGTTVAGRVMFPDFEPPHELAAAMLLDNPVSQFDRINAMAEAGYLIRTRSDTISGGNDFDPVRPVSAVNSGAQLISTDYPAPPGTPNEGFVLTLTGGTPARCNPVNAPAECTSEAIESAGRLQPR